MRAHDIISQLSPRARKALAQALQAEGVTDEALSAAMRAPQLAPLVLKRCGSPVMREDLALLCANPFDPVAPDELIDPDAFVALGMIAEHEGQFYVNRDMAITMTPSMPLEFGFAATMVARLSHADFSELARAMEIGPRTTHVDYILDIAEACVSDAHVMRQLAHLRASEREAIVEAIGNGELPDDIGELSPSAPPPLVSLDDASAGQRGLVFTFADASRGIDERSVILLELLPRVSALMERVPPAPEAAPARTTRRRTTSGSGSRTPTQKPRPVAASVTRDVYEDDPPSRTPTPTSPPSFRRADTTPTRSAGSASVQAASGVVDLETARNAEIACRDDELNRSILEVVAENLVVLRPGVDIDDWVERAAARLNFG